MTQQASVVVPLFDPMRRVVRVSTDGDDSLDRLLSSSTKGAYQRDFSRERVGWLARAAAHHIEHCPPYARLAAASGFHPSTLDGTADLARIPLLPSSMFKKKTVVSSCTGDVLVCRSSGTGGTVSRVHRDEPTMERFIASLLHGSAEFYERHEGRRGFVLGPHTDEAETLWFSYVLGLLDLSFDTDFFVRDETFRCRELAEALANLGADVQPLIIGPPRLILELCRWLIARGERLDLSRRSGLVVTAGGWKSHLAHAISREELTALVTDALGVAPDAVRDAFNMVELNSVLFECEHRRKHVPPWLEVIVRNPSDMSCAAPGEEGVLTYLDPSPTSYPGFVFSDDLGRLSSDSCECGRFGRTLALSRRLTKVEERGCALKLDRYTQGENQ